MADLYEDCTENLIPDSKLSGPTSVSEGPDAGGDECLAGVFQNSTRHRSTREAVNKLKPRTGNSEERLNIVGHGDPGYLETGSGGERPRSGKFIGIQNIGEWDSMLQELKDKKFSELRIYSCSTGAGDRGAKLLCKIAELTGKKVSARTGLTFCCKRDNRIFYQKGSEWQTALPGEGCPTPIEETPCNNFRMESRKIFFGGLEHTPQERNANIIRSVEIFSYSEESPEPKLYTYRRKIARRLGPVIFNATGKSSACEVLGVVTKKIDFTLHVGGKEEKKTVKVYNDLISVIKHENKNYMYAFSLESFKESTATLLYRYIRNIRNFVTNR